MTFVDTGAWFAFLVKTDSNHRAVFSWMEKNENSLLTTDYVVDETLTLLRTRGHREKALKFGRSVFLDQSITLHFLTPSEISDTWKVFERFSVKEWSFTDCASKFIMESLGIHTAFSFDQHFRQFGSVVVVP